MANTNPPVDTAAGVESLRERAAEEALIPVGFSATVTKGMKGEELTEMAELARPARSASPTTDCRSATPACARRCSTSGSAAA